MRPTHVGLALLLALPAVLGGCLLPQPDTPPVPPVPQSGRQAASAPGAKPPAEAARPTGSSGGASADGAGELINNNAGGLIANNNGGLISNSAGGLISNNPGAVSDQGAPAATAPMAPAPMASPLPAPGEPAPPGEIAMAGGGATFAPGTKAAATPAPGRLAVTLTGDAVSEVWILPAAGGPGVGPELKDGAFTIGLAAGEYHLELVVGGKRLRTTKPLAVPTGGERRLAVVVKGGTLTIEEQVPLEETAPEPTPVPTSKP